MNIDELRERPHLSASSINDYLDCGLGFKFSRIDRAEPEYISATLLFGKCIHKVLEEFHQAKMNGRKRILDNLLERFEFHWLGINGQATSIQFKEGDDCKSLLQKGWDILRVYYDQLPRDRYKVLATENPFSFLLEGIDIPLIGIMDLIEQDEAGNIIITDFKTSNRAYSKDEIDKNLQLTIYHMAAKRNGFSDREIILKFDCLIKTKTPKFEQYYTVRTEEDEKRVVRKIQEIWRGIQQGVFIPNDDGWKCGYCSFKQHCDAWFRRRELEP
jgi:putative RecB family exonuclease